MTTPATLAQSRSTLSDRSSGYDHASQRRMADPRDPAPFPKDPPKPTGADPEAW
jgi:hypothetical protein